jgi:putative sterol carrier protein
VLSRGSATVERGPDGPPADVTLRCDSATSTSIARGELSVPAAVLAGRLSTSGDVTVLVDAGVALEAVAEATRAVTALVDWSTSDA